MPLRIYCQSLGEVISSKGSITEGSSKSFQRSWSSSLEGSRNKSMR